MSNGNTEDVSYIIFSACDPEGCGEIPVVRLINYIEKEMQSCYDRSLLQELKLMLLLPLSKPELRIQKESFNIIIKDWITYVQEYKLSTNVLQSDDSQYGDYLTAHSYCSDINSVVSSLGNSSITQKQLEEKVTDLERQKNSLLDENNKLKTLLKDNEEALQCLTLDHNNLQENYNVLEKKLQVLKRVKQDFQELETIQQAQQLTNKELESCINCIEKENFKLKKSNSCLQTYVATLKEERTEAVKTSENLRKLLSEEKSNNFEMKHKYDLAFLKYDAEKAATVEKLKDLENVVSDLKNTVGFLKERKMELEDELYKTKVKCSKEPESLPVWRFLDESLSDVGETLKLIYCEQESETETNLRAELQASGDICLSHKQLEIELKDCHEKFEICSSELVECEKNLNTMSDVIFRSTELLKLIQNSTEELYPFSDEVEKINVGQYSGPCMLLVQNLFAELEKVAMMVTKLMKIVPPPSTKEDGQKEMVMRENATQTTSSDVHSLISSQSGIICCVHRSPEYSANGPSRTCPLPEIILHNNFEAADGVLEVSHVGNVLSPLNMNIFEVETVMTNKVDNTEYSIDSTSDLSIKKAPAADTSHSSSYSVRNLSLHILKFLVKCAINLVFYGGQILKILMFMFIFGILYVVTSKFIYECYLENSCGCYDIGELLSPHIKLHHYAPPPM